MNRINFYPQKYGKTAKTTPSDFNTLQDYIQAAIENAVKDAIPVPGCLSALDMAVTPNGDWRVVVSAGAGYDETGRRVYNGAAKLVDLGPVMYPVGTGNERYLRIVARAAVSQQEPREDAYGNTVYFRQIESVELAVRVGAEAPIGTATVPDAQTGDITRAVVRRYDGQLRIETGDINSSYGDILGIFVRQGDTLVGNLQGNVIGNLQGNVTGNIIGTTTDLANGAAGSIPYQNAEDSTTFLPKGVTGQFLRQGPSDAPMWGDIIIATGTVAHGGTIPLPDGYTQDQCKWFVSPRELHGNGYDLNSIRDIWCYADANRFVTCKTVDFNYYILTGVANYILIGVK